MAAIIGKAAFFGEDNSPLVNSRLSSKPTTKKKIAIKPSLTQCASDILNSYSPKDIPTYCCQKLEYSFAHGELAKNIAIKAAIKSTIPPVVDLLINLLTGCTTYFSAGVIRMFSMLK